MQIGIKLLKSLKHSINGIKLAYGLDKTISLEIMLTPLILIICYLFFNKQEMFILIILWFLIIVIELLNTSIEKTIDFISLEKIEEIKQIKDLSSGAVFITVSIFFIAFLYFIFF